MCVRPDVAFPSRSILSRLTLGNVGLHAARSASPVYQPAGNHSQAEIYEIYET